MVLTRRRTERLARTRRRNLWLAGSSLLTHLLIFLLLPGLAVEIAPRRELLIELVSPRAAGAQTLTQAAGKPVATPAQAGTAAEEAQSETTTSAKPVVVPEQPENAEPQPVEAQPEPEQASPQANEATSISSAPVTVPQSPEQVQDQPVEQEAVAVVDEPVSQPSPQPAKPAQARPAESKPAETPPAASQQQPADAESDSEESSTPEAEGNPGVTEGEDRPAEAEEAGGSDGEDAEGEGPPPGPSAAELRLLGEYGDAARLRIRSQARNPEQGGEGTVTFEFDVARDGHLIDVRVVRSSGYANLDNDALEATRAAFNERAEKVPFPRDVTVASWTFVMSLKYPLY
jgi:TonB family protein